MTTLGKLFERLPLGLRRLTLGSLGLLAGSLLAQLVDPRQVLGVSTWAKPAKFAIAVALTAFTLGLLVRHIQAPARRLRRAVGAIAWLTALELVIITFQSARGVPSHFNNRTLFDLVLFQVAGVAILIVTVAFGYLTVAAFRQRFERPALGWGIRLGLVSLLFGSAMGGLMPGPTTAQLDTLRSGELTPLVGAHSVGVPDGGPGLPVTGWSTQGGDLRIPHFVGLHGFQVLPLVALLLERRRGDQRQAARLTAIAGVGYLGVTAVLLVQALRAQPLLAPDPLTLTTLSLVLGGSALAAFFSASRAGHAHRDHEGAGAAPSTTPPGGPDAGLDAGFPAAALHQQPVPLGAPRSAAGAEHRPASA